MSSDQTRSTRDILHLIQSRASDESSMPVSSAATCNTETVSNGLRQFQVRPQLFEAIMMQPSTSVGTSVGGDVKNDSASAHAKQSVTGSFLFM